MEQVLAEPYTTREDAVTLRVAQIARRMGCDEHQVEQCVLRALAALASADSAVRAIKKGVEHAAQVTAPKVTDPMPGDELKSFGLTVVALVLLVLLFLPVDAVLAHDSQCDDKLVIVENAPVADDSRTLTYCGSFTSVSGNTLHFQNAPCHGEQRDNIFTSGFEHRETWNFYIQTFAVMPFHIGPVLCEYRFVGDDSAHFICGPTS
jgi:hypothetical protein